MYIDAAKRLTIDKIKLSQLYTGKPNTALEEWELVKIDWSKSKKGPSVGLG